MAQAPEPIQDVAHLGHIELSTPRPEESLWFFREVMGMEETARHGQSVYLRAYGDYYDNTLKLTEDNQAGITHVGWRAVSPQALERRVRAIEPTGLGKGWVDGDEGHGSAYQFTDPDGHLMELYYDTHKYRAPDDQRSYLKNQPQKQPGRGVGVWQLDHLNLLASDVTENREFMQEYLGFKLRENVVLDDGTESGAWISVTPLVHDTSYSLDGYGAKARLHHAGFCVENREDVLRAADLFSENGIFIESGPSKHKISHQMFIYVYEPGGNRIEVVTRGYLIFVPDWEPITWSQADRRHGQAWGLQLPKSFHSYGTPVVEEPAEVRDIPVFDPA